MEKSKSKPNNCIKCMSFLQYFMKPATVVPCNRENDETGSTSCKKVDNSEKNLSASDRLFYNKISKPNTIFINTISAASTEKSTKKSTNMVIKYPRFYEKNVVITPEDYELVKYSWKLVMDEDLPYFNDMKKSGIISLEKTAVSWFYDMFYENVYSYDEFTNNNMTEIFKNNMKIQAHALIVIIKNSIHIAQSYSIGKKVNFDTMYKAHRDINLLYNHYVIISEILLTTFERCLCDKWTRDMEAAWCKTISILLQAAAHDPTKN